MADVSGDVRSEEAGESLRFHGFARLDLAAFDFGCASVIGHRAVNDRNVTRMLNIFRKEGCRRADPNNAVEALVDLSRVHVALPQLLPENCEEIPMLSLGTVHCLNGLHRLLAARQYLNANDQWWVARLFSKERTHHDCVAVAEEYKNELEYGDGEIFRKIRLYKKVGDKENERKWWARLSRSKSKNLRQLLKDERYTDVFDDMVHWPGIWSPIQLGSLHRFHTMKCDEEILNYLRHVVDYWSSILADLDHPLPQDALDEYTVRKLEKLAPAFSQDDEAVVRDLIGGDKIFPSIRRSQDRSAVLERLLNFPTMIPSLCTFFESLVYLEPCAKILRKLLPPKQGCSIRQALWSSYCQPTDLKVEYFETDLRPHPRSSAQADFILSYQQLWLVALRKFVTMIEVTPRMERGREKPRVCERDPYAWKSFGSFATIQGFQTSAAREFEAEDAAKALATRMTKRFGTGAAQSEAIRQVANILRQLPEPSGQAHSPKFTGDNPLARERRCGMPFEDDHYHDSSVLFLPTMYSKPSQKGQHVTSLFCKWDMFRSFMGINAECDENFTADRPDAADTSPVQHITASNCPRCHEMVQALDAAQQKTRDLESSREAKDSQLSSLQAEYQRQCVAIDSLRTSLDAQLRDAQTITDTQLRELEREVAGRHVALIELQEKYGESQKSVESLRDQISRLERQLREEQGSIDAEAARQIRSLQNKLSATQSSLNEQQELEKELREKLTHCENDRSSLEARLFAAEEARSMAETSNAKLDAMLESQSDKEQQTRAQLEESRQQLTTKEKEIADLQQLLQSLSEATERDEILADSTKYQLEMRLEDSQRSAIATEERTKQLQSNYNMLGEAFAQMARDKREYELRLTYKEPDFLILRFLIVEDVYVGKRDEVLNPETARNILVQAEKFSLEDFEFFVGPEHKHVVPVEKTVGYLEKAWFSRQMLWIVRSAAVAQLDTADGNQWTSLNELAANGFTVGPDSKILYHKQKTIDHESPSSKRLLKQSGSSQPTDQSLVKYSRTLRGRVSKGLGPQEARTGTKRKAIPLPDPKQLKQREKILQPKKRLQERLNSHRVEELDD